MTNENVGHETENNITHISLTLYKNDHHDNLLYKRLKRKLGRDFKRKVFSKNEIDYIVQEPDFFKFYDHFNSASGVEETVKRVNTISFLFVSLNLFCRLKKITFIVSEREDTQKKFRNEEGIFSFSYGIEKVKIDLRNAFRTDISMNKEVLIQQMIQEFKKAIRNGYYDIKLMKMMDPQLKIHLRAVNLYIIISSFDEKTFDAFKPCINYILNVINNSRILNSNPIVMVE